MREPARSARSDTGRESAFFKSSAASWVMGSFYPQRVRLRQERNEPYTGKKKTVGIDLSPEVVDYFKGLAEETGLPAIPVPFTEKRDKLQRTRQKRDLSAHRLH